MVCPTNDDPTYDGRPRVKRTTGIPRSFLKTVQKPTQLIKDGTVDDTKQPAGVMVNADGEWVVAEPDQAAWAQYQAKAKVAAVAQEAAARGSKELQDKGLECSIDKRLFVDPTKTPCCQSTFCHDCITNALLENDLRCPECSTENVPVDDLVPDEQMMTKVQSYEREMAAESAPEESSGSQVEDRSSKVVESPPNNDAVRISLPRKSQKIGGNALKRHAESELASERKAPNPACGGPMQSTVNGSKSDQQELATASRLPGGQQSSLSNGDSPTPQMMSSAVFPNVSGVMGLPMSMAPAMNMNATMQNPMLMANSSFMGNDWNNVWGAGFPHQSMTVPGSGFQNGLMLGGSYNQYNSMGNNYMSMDNGGMSGQGIGPFANQQRTTFGTPKTNEEDGAYFRKPVNPHRHQARRNVQRPTDYREI